MMMITVVTGYFIELLTLFAIIFIHELGHAAAAKGFAWRITEIQLLPFGGVAVVEELGTVPVWEEIIVALAGPLQNGFMIIFALVMQKLGVWNDAWSEYFIQANMIIGLFNLLPILPLDGGRVMQSLFSLWINYYQTLRYGSWLSIMMSSIMILGACLHMNSLGIRFNLLMIGCFLLFSNIFQYRNLHYQFIRFLMNRAIHASALCENGAIAVPIVVKKTSRIKEIIRLFMREQYHLIYVVNEQGIIQVVVPEQKIVTHYLVDKKRSSAVSDLFM